MHEQEKVNATPLDAALSFSTSNKLDALYRPILLCRDTDLERHRTTPLPENLPIYASIFSTIVDFTITLSKSTANSAVRKEKKKREEGSGYIFHRRVKGRRSSLFIIFFRLPLQARFHLRRGKAQNGEFWAIPNSQKLYQQGGESEEAKERHEACRTSAS